MSISTLFNGHVIASGLLNHAGPYAGQPYSCGVLSPPHFEAIMELQQAVYDALADHEKAFVVPKSRDQVKEFLSREKGAIIGVCAGEKLVAQSMILFPKSTHPADSTITDCPVWPAAVEETAVLLGSVVHPAARGNNLQHVMFGANILRAVAGSKKHVLCEVAAENPYSWANVLKSGGFIASAGTDPLDGTRLLNGVIALSHPPVLDRKHPAQTLSPVAHFAEVAQMLNSGEYVGARVTADKQSLVLHKCKGWGTKSPAGLLMGA